MVLIVLVKTQFLKFFKRFFVVYYYLEVCCTLSCNSCLEMNLTNEQIRLLIMHEWKSGLNGKEVTARINEIWGEGTVGQSTVYKWIERFKAGEESLKDDPRSGRPIEVDRHAALAAIEETPSLTTRILTEDFDCDHKTIVNILHELGKI